MCESKYTVNGSPLINPGPTEFIVNGRRVDPKADEDLPDRSLLENVGKPESGQRSPYRVYLSGPMTGYDELNKPAFHSLAERLRDMGYFVINPADVPDGRTWNESVMADIREMLEFRPDALVMLPGWERSRGASLEAFVARIFGIPLMREVPGTLVEIPASAGWNISRLSNAVAGGSLQVHTDERLE